MSEPHSRQSKPRSTLVIWCNECGYVGKSCHVEDESPDKHFCPECGEDCGDWVRIVEVIE